MSTEQLDNVMNALMAAKIAADRINVEGHRFSYRTQVQCQITSLIDYVEGWIQIEERGR